MSAQYFVTTRYQYYCDNGCEEHGLGREPIFEYELYPEMPCDGEYEYRVDSFYGFFDNMHPDMLGDNCILMSGPPGAEESTYYCEACCEAEQEVYNRQEEGWDMDEGEEKELRITQVRRQVYDHLTALLMDCDATEIQS